MIALTGTEEEDLREFWEHLEVKPPLVGVLRQAVREFLVKRSREPRNKYIGVHPEWAAKFKKKHPPLVIIP